MLFACQNCHFLCCQGITTLPGTCIHGDIPSPPGGADEQLATYPCPLSLSGKELPLAKDPRSDQQDVTRGITVEWGWNSSFEMLTKMETGSGDGYTAEQITMLPQKVDLKDKCILMKNEK